MVAIDETFSGAIELQPTIRPEAKEIIQYLHQRGKTLVIISGDHEAPIRLLAEELGIDHYFANTLPENKANIILELQQEGRTVCFVGDGINDAIALKQADVSISLCGATTIATDTALMILMDGNLKQLTKLFTLAQEFKNNMNSIIVMTLLPQVILIGGTLFLHWGLVTTIVTNQLCWIPQLAWLFRPLHKHKGENGTLSNEN
jgi:P-type E1-E2 ATPase